MEAGQNGKRQRATQDEGTVSHTVPNEVEKDVGVADLEPKAKRQRVKSPPRGYNDPPDSLFPAKPAVTKPTRADRSVSPTHSEMSQDTIADRENSEPPISSPLRDMSVVSDEGAGRHSAGPVARATTWTQSAPAPPFAGSLARDHSMPPPPSAGMRQPFRMRGSFSMTPQPSGRLPYSNTARGGRSARSQPPLLADLMARPAFVHPPEDVSMRGVSPAGHRRSASLQSTMTLGAIAESRVCTLHTHIGSDPRLITFRPHPLCTITLFDVKVRYMQIYMPPKNGTEAVSHPEFCWVLYVDFG